MSKHDRCSALEEVFLAAVCATAIRCIYEGPWSQSDFLYYPRCHKEQDDDAEASRLHESPYAHVGVRQASRAHGLAVGGRKPQPWLALRVLVSQLFCCSRA
jgi:hypothetical protein